MKVLMNYGVVRDVPSDVAEILISKGDAVKYVAPAKSVPPADVSWTIMPAEAFEPPTLKFACSGCGLHGYTRGPGAHFKEVRHTDVHLGIASVPPKHIADEYQQRYARWAERAPKKEISAAEGYTPEQLKAYRPKSATR